MFSISMSMNVVRHAPFVKFSENNLTSLPQRSLGNFKNSKTCSKTLSVRRLNVLNATDQSKTTSKQVNANNSPVPGFGKEDANVAFKKRSNKSYIGTKDVASGPFDKPGTVDASGQKGKGLGVYQFSKKYDGNIDTYAPIYNPESFGDDYITAMSDEDFIKFMIPFTAFFFSIPLLVWLLDTGVL